jgi:hypothetical protein
MKKFISSLFVAMTAAVLLTSCDKEEEVALTMSGTWETSSQLFTRTYHGQTLRTTKTVFFFEHEQEHSISGYGYAVEYYDNSELPMTYHHIRWETWTRKNGDVGIEVDYSETHDKFATTSYSLDDQNFSGQCNLNDGSPQPFTFKRGTMPDLSKVKHWGYNELIPTWHPVTYEGQLDIRREFQGTIFKPTSVVITLDVDPAYNTGGPWNDNAYVMEKYDNAPWGTYLADSIKRWQVGDWIHGKELELWFANSDNSTSDYEMWNVEFNGDTMTGEIFVETNVFTPFTMRRTDSPDWSAIPDWGFSNIINKYLRK